MENRSNGTPGAEHFRAAAGDCDDRTLVGAPASSKLLRLESVRLRIALHDFEAVQCVEQHQYWPTV